MNDKTRIATLDELLDVGLLTREVPLSADDLDTTFTVKVRELTGEERFEMAEKHSKGSWQMYRDLCRMGMVEPAVESDSDIDKLRPEWVQEIANVVADISGMSANSEDEAAKKSEGVITDIGSGLPATSDARSAKREAG